MSFIYDLEEHEFAIICIAIISISVVGLVWWAGPISSAKYNGSIQSIDTKYTTTTFIPVSCGKNCTSYIPVTNYYTSMTVKYNSTKIGQFTESSWQWNKGDNVCVIFTYFHDKAFHTESINQGKC